MEPNPVWSPGAHEDTVDALAELPTDATVHVWAGDWCPDCRAQLPDFAAALAAAEIPDDRVATYPVEQTADGSKTGERVDEFDVERIPTIVVERDGTELARVVERSQDPLAVALAAELSDADSGVSS
jgi:thioredoxin 1